MNSPDIGHSRMRMMVVGSTTNTHTHKYTKHNESLNFAVLDSASVENHYDKNSPENIASVHFPNRSYALSCSCSRWHSCSDTLAAGRLRVDAVDYCTDYHNNWRYCKHLIALVIAPGTLKFVDEPYMTVTLESGDCSFELVIAFVVDPDLILGQHV